MIILIVQCRLCLSSKFGEQFKNFLSSKNMFEKNSNLGGVCEIFASVEHLNFALEILNNFVSQVLKP
jgi:hypothetical protein